MLNLRQVWSRLRDLETSCSCLYDVLLTDSVVGSSQIASDIPTSFPSAEPISRNHETITEESKQKPSLVKIPSRTSSNQKSRDATAATQPTSAPVADDPPSPRRGSKRSLLSRSRNGSRSSRRSGRAAKTSDTTRDPVPPLPAQHDGTSSQKKPRSGLLALLNCCSPQEDLDLKNEEAPVPAKKTKIQPPLQRTAQPETITTEKDVENRAPLEDKKVAAPSVEDEMPVLSEKQMNTSSRPRITREELSHDKIAPVQATNEYTELPVVQPTVNDEIKNSPVDPNPETVEPRSAMAYDQVTKPDVNIIAATPVLGQTQVPDQDWKQEESKINEDVDMPDAPVVAPEVGEERVDEPPQPAELQPQMPLPPPPPLAQRQEQGLVQEVPPVPEAVPEQKWLLGPIQPQFKGRKCLVLDLDETLVHSSFKILNQADFTIPVEIEGQYHNVYVIKRPGVDQFMKRVGELYEVVVFTASVSKYGDPLLDQLDIHHVVHHRLFRESCYNHQGNYVKVSLHPFIH